MFARSSRFYDTIYHWKDYAAEAQKIHEVVQRHNPEARTLLDVACGTGLHLQHLARNYAVEGLDVNTDLLAVARERLPEVRFTEADMETMDLGKKFDAITCLFSSIGYVRTVARLDRTLKAMARHLQPGGVLIIEPWFSPANFIAGHIGAIFVDNEDVKIARINDSRVRGGISVLTLHYLVGAPEGISYFKEEHALGLFTDEEHLDAFAEAGLSVTHDEEGLMGRGLYVGLQPAAG
jgi:ubiquinone/menaquinone biosynthesis C-methylase UbiE